MIDRLRKLIKNVPPYYPVLTILVVSIFVIINLFYSTIEITPKDRVTTIYYVDHISGAHQKLIDLFNQRYAGRIKVEAINLPFNTFSTNERKELLARYLRSKSDRIDIFAIDQIWGPRFAKWGVNLDNYFTENETGLLFDRALESCYYQDSLISIPLYIDISLLYARKDLILNKQDGAKRLSELQSTISWESFIKLKNEMNLPNPFYTYQAENYEGLMCILTELIASQGGSIVRDGALYINGNQELKKAIQLLVDLVNSEKLSPRAVTSFKENESFRYFISNNGVFIRAWPSFSGNDEKVFPGFSALKNDLIFLPNPYFVGKKKVAVFGGWNLMVSKNSRKINESITFLKFAVSEEAQKIMYSNGQYLPIVNSIYNDSVFLKHYPELSFFKDYLLRGVHRPFLKDYTRISDILVYYVKAAINKEMGVDEAISEAGKKIKSNKVIL